METYSMKSLNPSGDFVTILRETDEGYIIRIVRNLDGYEEIINDFITKELFNSCLRTGYLTKISVEEKHLVASA